MSICNRCRAHAAERSRYPLEYRRCITCGYVEYTPARSSALPERLHAQRPGRRKRASAAAVKRATPAVAAKAVKPKPKPNAPAVAAQAQAQAEYQIAMALFG